MSGPALSSIYLGPARLYPVLGLYYPVTTLKLLKSCHRPFCLDPSSVGCPALALALVNHVAVRRVRKSSWTELNELH